MVDQVAQRPFTVAEYYKMAESGILCRDEHLELIDGRIMLMLPIGSRHAACVDRLSSLFHRMLGAAVIVRHQNPIRLNRYSEPIPDVALLKVRDDYYAEAHPTPEDVWLVVEVADSSLQYDRESKIPLYATAGIPEVWLVNVQDDTIEVFHNPHEAGYTERLVYKRGESLYPQAFITCVLRVNDILVL